MPESIVTILDVAIGGLLLGGIYALIAMGLSLQYGVARVLNVSHGEFIMIGAFSTFSLYTVSGINPLICLVIVGPATFLVGYLLHRTLFRQLSLKAPNADAYAASSILASFGLLFIFQNIALIAWGADYRAYTYLNFGVSIGGAIFSANKLVILGFAIGVRRWMNIEFDHVGSRIKRCPHRGNGVFEITVSRRFDPRGRARFVGQAGSIIVLVHAAMCDEPETRGGGQPMAPHAPCRR